MRKCAFENWTVKLPHISNCSKLSKWIQNSELYHYLLANGQNIFRTFVTFWSGYLTNVIFDWTKCLFVLKWTHYPKFRAESSVKIPDEIHEIGGAEDRSWVCDAGELRNLGYLIRRAPLDNHWSPLSLMSIQTMFLSPMPIRDWELFTNGVWN